MKLRTLANQRGNVLLFTVILVLPLMLIFAGLAVDLGYLGEVDAELQRAMDAAALAGAGTLGFSCANFHPARVAAQQYAGLNPYRVGTINLDLNETGPGPCNPQNDSGDIVLGDWDENARTFTPSTNGDLVDAVRTTYKTTIPTSFLRVIGVTGLGAAATATAWTPPPSKPSSGCCPIALEPTGGIPSGNGICGQQAYFISSGEPSAAGYNTAGWARLTGCGTPGANEIRTAIDNCAAGTQPCPLQKNDYIGINGGMVEPALNDVAGYFQTKYPVSETFNIYSTDPDTGENILPAVYSGQGWAITVPVVNPVTQTSDCPLAPLAWSPFKGTMLASLWDKVFSCAVPSPAFAVNVNQNMQIVGWTEFVITQVIENGKCVVDNPNDNVNKLLWPRSPDCSNGVTDPNNALRGIYGYFNCKLFDSPGDGGFVTARGKPRLVK